MTMIFAHRGFSGYYPENTMLAFQKVAEETVADGIELDIRKTQDGVIIVNHNRDVCGQIIAEHTYEELKETVLKVAEYSNSEKEVKRKKLNKCFIIGGICFLLVILNHQFGVLAMIFNNPIDDFVAGALTSLGILFEFVGFYNNNHEVSLKQRKQELFMRKDL